MKSDIIKTLALVFAFVMVIVPFLKVVEKEEALERDAWVKERLGYSESETEEQSYSEPETEVVSSEPEYVLSVEDAKTGAMMATIKELTHANGVEHYKLLMSSITETETTITVVFPVDIWFISGGGPDTRWISTSIYDKYSGQCISFTIT